MGLVVLVSTPKIVLLELVKKESIKRILSN